MNKMVLAFCTTNNNNNKNLIQSHGKDMRVKTTNDVTRVLVHHSFILGLIYVVHNYTQNTQIHSTLSLSLVYVVIVCTGLVIAARAPIQQLAQMQRNSVAVALFFFCCCCRFSYPARAFSLSLILLQFHKMPYFMLFKVFLFCWFFFWL